MPLVQLHNVSQCRIWSRNGSELHPHLLFKHNRINEWGPSVLLRLMFLCQSNFFSPLGSLHVTTLLGRNQMVHGNQHKSLGYSELSRMFSFPGSFEPPREQFCIAIRDWQLKVCFHIKSNHKKLARETLECCEIFSVLRWPTFLHLLQSVSTWFSFYVSYCQGNLQVGVVTTEKDYAIPWRCD